MRFVDPKGKRAPTVPDLKIGIDLACLGQPLKKALHTAARLGGQGVKIDARSGLRPQEMGETALRQFRKLLEDKNLKISSVSFPTRRGYDDTNDLDARITATKAAMKFAYQIGASVVIGQVGHVPDDEESPSWTTLVEALTDLGAYGHHIGAVWPAKTGSVPPEDLARLLGALPTGAIGIDLEPGRLVIQGFSAAEAVSTLGANILHVTVSDGVRDLAQGRGLEVSLGRGSADFAELLGQLEERQYRGWFTIERHETDDPISEIGNAVEYLRNL